MAGDGQERRPHRPAAATAAARPDQENQGRRFAAARGLCQEYEDTCAGDSIALRHRRIQLARGATDAQGLHEVPMQLGGNMRVAQSWPASASS